MPALKAEHPEKRVAPLRDTNDDHVTWRLARIDLDGAWSPLSLSAQDLRDVLGKLAAAEQMTWGECMKPGKHQLLKQIPVTNLSSAAQARFRKLKLQDFDSVIEYHLRGLWRVWGLRVGGACELLWWDEHHKVCPSTKRRT